MSRARKKGDGFESEGKITFNDVYSDFRRRHPNLRKEVIHWKPYDYLKIKVYLDNGMILIHDYWHHTATVCKENWRRDNFRPSDWRH